LSVQSAIELPGTVAGSPLAGVAAMCAEQATLSPVDCRDLLEWLRQVTDGRTRSGPRAMATPRNLAVGALRLAGRTDIAEATRWATRNVQRPFTILGLLHDLETTVPDTGPAVDPFETFR
jgi:hypothetical protein